MMRLACPAVAALCLLLAHAPAVIAQGRSPAVVAAEGHRTRGELAEAIRLLRAHLLAEPDDGDAARVLAETLYWTGDLPAARLVYETAIARHPDDSLVRLQFARMLLETDNRTEARAWLSAIQSSASGAAAEALLGTLAYWEGDLAAATRYFESALQRDAGLAEARRQLEEIRAVTSPWLRFGAALRHDDQPLDRFAGGIEAGWFLTPETAVLLRLDPMQFRFGGTTRDLWLGEVEGRHSNGRGFQATVAAGALAGWDRPQLTARARVSVRPAPGTDAGVEVSRAPYLWTTSSLSIPVMPGAIRAFATVSRHGFGGEAAVERRWFQDGNSVGSAYGWLLVPVARGAGATLQAGYAFSVEDATDSRFVLADPDQPVPPGDPGFDLGGRYDPYYTPEERRTHAALGALTVQHGGGARLHLGGSFSVRTTELVPEYTAIGGDAVRMFVPRQSHPWEARVQIDVPVHPQVLLSAHAGMGRKPFYDWRGGAVSLVYRVRSGPGRGGPGAR